MTVPDRSVRRLETVVNGVSLSYLRGGSRPPVLLVHVDELLAARAQSLARGVSRPLGDAERETWLGPWHAEDRVRSWTAMAGAADARYALELVDRLRERAPPTLLIWGEQDEFQRIEFAERYSSEIPAAPLIRIPGARHIPTVDNPDLVAASLISFLGDSPTPWPETG